MTRMLAADDRFKPSQLSSADKEILIKILGFELMTLDAILYQMSYHTKKIVIQASNGLKLQWEGDGPVKQPLATQLLTHFLKTVT